MSEFLTGKFAVNKGSEGQLAIRYESGQGPTISLVLFADQQPLENVQALVETLNLAVAAIRIEAT